MATKQRKLVTALRKRHDSAHDRQEQFLKVAHKLALGILVSSIQIGLAQETAPELRTALVPPRLTVAEAEKILFEHNLALAASRYQLDASKAARRIAGYKPNPFVQLGMEQIPVQSPVPGSVPRFFSTDSNAGANPVYTLQLNQLFERGGKLEIRRTAADAQVEATRAQILETFRKELYQLRQALAAAILARENLKLAQSLDQDYDQIENLTTVRLRTGDASELELYRARAGRLPFKQAILDAQNSYRQAALDILNLLNARPESTNAAPAQEKSDRPGLEPKPPPVGERGESAVFRPAIEIVGDFSARPVPATPADLRTIAFTHRPDLLMARNNLLMAEQGVKLAQAARKRDITLGLEYQRVGDDHSVGMIAQIPLFLYNNQKAGIAQAEAQQRAAEAQLRQAELQVITDVESAYQAYLAAKAGVDLYSADNLIQVEKLREIARFSYQRGASSLFEVLDAERISKQAATAFQQARASYQLALWQLEASLGVPLDQP